MAVAATMALSTALAGQHLAVADAGPAPSVPAPRLAWKPCQLNTDYDCATAKVPLDYAKPRGRTIELAVVKRRATNPGRRIGTLFFNPGGPGGPGTIQFPQNYKVFPKEVRERFDLVSWDPRGIGNSTAVNCFETPEQAAEWNASHPVGFPVGKAERQAWIDAYRELGRLCNERDPELLRHVGTVDTARDLDQLRRAVGEQRLTYLGISYGTILGATYANLFPSRVRAMVLDSNVAPDAFTNNGNDNARLPVFLRTGSDRTGAATLAKFLDLCGAAPARRCAFSAGSPAATRKKWDRLMDRLRERPVGPWTYARTVADSINHLYVVHPGWTELAVLLQELWEGREPGPAPAPPADPLPYPVPYQGEEQAAAVECGDTPNPRNPYVYHQLEEASAARTGAAGRFWTWAAEPCATWPAVSAYRYSGPWNRPTAPILVVGTYYDPSTPYSNAQDMAKELANARLLTNTGYGHTALLNPSRCINAHESRYLIDGVLPPPGTRCTQDAPPF
ncbi:alpha/beta hydrolase [Streptomyces sp. NBC_01017]|uniref:alpha/beta hydrolase n=1 Tax=Streptomyces sp. NBC_01017 TaxID=2903721 RepID=UPI0038655DBD|nr:alpha/beta hydrolase [Streptomyces sp. NBC_01017]